jgi:hypothetical protein
MNGTSGCSCKAESRKSNLKLFIEGFVVKRVVTYVRNTAFARTKTYYKYYKLLKNTDNYINLCTLVIHNVVPLKVLTICTHIKHLCILSTPYIILTLNANYSLMNINRTVYCSRETVCFLSSGNSGPKYYRD